MSEQRITFDFAFDMKHAYFGFRDMSLVRTGMNVVVRPEFVSREIHALAERYRAANPRIVDLGLPASNSVELIVDALPGATLFDLGGLHDALQELLKTRVDLWTPGDLPVDLRERVLASARPI